MLARFTLASAGYRPVTALPNVVAPLLLLAAERDELCPAPPIRAAAEAARAARADRAARNASGGGVVAEGGEEGGVEYVELAGASHFDSYRGEPFETAVGAMTRFLVRHLRPQAGAGKSEVAGGVEAGEGAEGAAATS